MPRVRWPSPGSRWAAAPGTCAASQLPCDQGTIMSWSPCQIATGAPAPTSAMVKPQSEMNARSSSRHPAMPVRTDARNEAAR